MSQPVVVAVVPFPFSFYITLAVRNLAVRDIVAVSCAPDSTAPFMFFSPDQLGRVSPHGFVHLSSFLATCLRVVLGNTIDRPPRQSGALRSQRTRRLPSENVL